MARVTILWLALVGLLATAASAQGAEMPPLPEPHPTRSVPATSVIHAPPPPDKKPNISRAEPRAEKIDPRVFAARANCDELLEGLTLDYQPLPPIRKGACGTSAPILVKSVGANPAVAISPPAIMNCRLAAALFIWLEKTVQPSANVLGSSVVKIRNASSYKCRRRYGDTNTKISEHAFANALDISEFVFATGQRVKVLGNWPYGARTAAISLAPALPLPNPHRVAALFGGQNAAVSQETTGAIISVSTRNPAESCIVPVTKVSAIPLVRPIPRQAAPPPRSPLPQPSPRLSAVLFVTAPAATSEAKPFISPLPLGGLTNPVSKRGNVEAEKVEVTTSVEPAPPRILQPDEAAALLRVIHADGCKIFETVLGPGANAAHRDHFHFDMKKRPYVKICE
jgi:hypothetical protein